TPAIGRRSSGGSGTLILPTKRADLRRWRLAILSAVATALAIVALRRPVMAPAMSPAEFAHSADRQHVAARRDAAVPASVAAASKPKDAPKVADAPQA